MAYGVIIKKDPREVFEVSPTHKTRITVEVFRVRVITELELYSIICVHMILAA